MLFPKGGKRHRKIGRLFVTGMKLTGGSSLLMAQIKPNPFLFIIGVFTIYLVGTADRYIKLKQTLVNRLGIYPRHVRLWQHFYHLGHNHIDKIRRNGCSHVGLWFHRTLQCLSKF